MRDINILDCDNYLIRKNRKLDLTKRYGYERIGYSGTDTNCNCRHI